MVSAHRSEKGKMLFIPSYADVQNASLQQSVFSDSCVQRFFDKPLTSLELTGYSSLVTEENKPLNLLMD